MDVNSSLSTVINIVREYKQEIENAKSTSGLRGSLVSLKNKVIEESIGKGKAYGLDFSHLYTFHRLSEESESFAFYQIPYSESETQRVQNIVQELKNSNIEDTSWTYTLDDSSELDAVNEALSTRKDLAVPFNDLKFFHEFLSPTNIDDYGFLTFNTSQQVLLDLQKFLENIGNKYSPELKNLESTFFSEADHLIATNIYHESTWISTLLVTLYDEKNYLNTEDYKKVHREYVPLLYLLRPLISEKLYHFVFQNRFIKNPLSEDVSWALSEVLRLCYTVGATQYNLDEKYNIGASPMQGRQSQKSSKCSSRHSFLLRESSYKLRLSNLEKKPPKNLINHVLNRVEKTTQLTGKLRSNMRRAALASIMARNMSHNIGSHVLASPELLKIPFDKARKIKKDHDSDDKNTEEIVIRERGKVQSLHSFLQQRMDFIARIISYTPSWGEPTFFLEDLLDQFLSQVLLLEYLLKDQGYARKDINFFVHKGDESIRFEMLDSPNEETGLFVSKNGNMEDFLVLIPGGSIGAHAFYDILENVMRNSAKYGIGLDGSNNMEVHLNIEPMVNRLRVTLWDNLSPNNKGSEDDKNRVELVKEPLAKPLVDPKTGNTRSEGRGLQEVKECARLLAHPYEKSEGWQFDVETDESIKKLPVNAVPKEHNDQSYLSYQFYLQSPHLVGIACPGMSSCLDREVQNDLREAGIYTYSGTDEDLDALEPLLEFSHQFGIIWLPDGENYSETEKSVLKFIGDNHRLLPYRLILAGSRAHQENLATKLQSREDIPNRRVQVCAKDRLSKILSSTDGNWSKSVLRIYEIWLKKFKSIGENSSSWEIVILFSRKEGSFPFRKWMASLDGFDYDLIDVHIGSFEEDDNHFNSIEASTDGISDPKVLAERIDDHPEKFIIFDNHGNGIDALHNYCDSYSPKYDKDLYGCYHAIGQKRALKLYQSLESPPQDPFGAGYFVLGLLESALANVLVIDERLAEATFTEEQGLSARYRLLERLIHSGTYTTFSLWTSNGDRCTRTYVSESIENTEKSFRPAKCLKSKEGLYLGCDDKSVKNSTVIRQDAAGNRSRIVNEDKGRLDGGSLCGNDRIDTIVIHQGVLDRLANLDRWNKESNLQNMYQMSPTVVVTSGRGKNFRDDSTPETMPFLEFSVIRESTYAEMSKFHLVRALFSVVGKDS